MATQAAEKTDNAPQAISPVVMTLAVGKPKRKPAKFTPAKRKAFLQYFGTEYNITKAAAKAGISRETIYYYLEQDETFAAAFQTIKDAYLDNVEEASFTMAAQASRDGFQDRKLLLQAHRREIYGDKVQVNSDVRVNVEHSIPQLSAILAGNGLRELSGPQEIPYQEVREENQTPVKSKVTEKD